MDNLVDKDAHNFIVSALRRMLDVVQREMDFFMRLGAKSVGHTVHRAKNKQNLLHTRINEKLTMYYYGMKIAYVVGAVSGV